MEPRPDLKALTFVASSTRSNCTKMRTAWSAGKPGSVTSKMSTLQQWEAHGGPIWSMPSVVGGSIPLRGGRQPLHAAGWQPPAKPVQAVVAHVSKPDPQPRNDSLGDGAVLGALLAHLAIQLAVHLARAHLQSPEGQAGKAGRTSGTGRAGRCGERYRSVTYVE